MSRDEEAARVTGALTAALSGLADALTQLDLAGALEAEPVVAGALASVHGLAQRPPTTLDRRARGVWRTELHAARAALHRCASLGASLDAYARRPFASAATYTASGAQAVVPGPSAFQQRV